MKIKKILLLFAVMISCAIILTGCVDIPSFTEPTSTLPQNIENIEPGEDLVVYFMDVGQADCSLIIFPDKTTMLIDAGNNEDGQNLVNTFKSMNISKIDILIGTHPHEDHIGGLDDIINNFNIGEIYMPDATSDSKTFADVVHAISNKGLSINEPVPGDIIYNNNDIKATILAPNASSYEDLNNYSIVVKLVYKNNSFLFMGDAESVSENEILNKNFVVKADVLKVGHHGSSSSSSIRFLNAVHPRYAVIQCETGNKYGHPHKETLTNLNDMGITVFRNDLNGTIKAIANGSSISFEVEKIGETDVKETQTTATEPANNDTHMVYVTPNGKKYHEKGCTNLGKQVRELTVEEAIREGYEPGKCCHNN